jgi:hypothetical protein
MAVINQIPLTQRIKLITVRQLFLAYATLASHIFRSQLITLIMLD